MKITDIRCYLIEDEHPAHPFRWRKGLPGSGDGTAAERKPLAAVLRMDTDAGVTWNTMEEYERHIKECIDEGFSAFKLHAWGDAREDAKLCRNLRHWAGDEAPLMFDGSAGWDLVTALWFGRVLEDCGFYWYEEP